jgi:hypothetical protein
MPVHFDLPDTGISFFPSARKARKLISGRQASLCAVCRSSWREREELRSFVIGFRLLEDRAALLTKMGSSPQARMLSHLWKRGVTTAVQQEVLPELPYD